MRFIKFAVLLMFVSSILYAESKQIGVISDLEGDVSLISGSVEKKANVGMFIEKGMKVITKEGSRIKIMMKDDSLFVIAPKTELLLDEYLVDHNSKSRRSLLGLIRGKVLFYINKAFSNSQSKFEVKTKTSIAGVRGTKFVMECSDDEFVGVGVFNGEVEIMSGDKNVLVGSEKYANSRNSFLLAGFDKNFAERYQEDFKIKKGKMQVAMMSGGTRMSGESLLNFQLERNLLSGAKGEGGPVSSHTMSTDTDFDAKHSGEQKDREDGFGETEDISNFGAREGTDVGITAGAGGNLLLRIKVLLPFVVLKR